jgi:sarcosine oxidase subunit gamma
MGVDQYLVEATPDTGSRKSAATRLAAALGAAASVTDQSDAYVRFDLEGDRVAGMLERLSAADNAGMDAGAAVRTPIHHMLCLLICREPGRRFTVYGPRSSAESLHHALTAAAGSLGAR